MAENVLTYSRVCMTWTRVKEVNVLLTCNFISMDDGRDSYNVRRLWKHTRVETRIYLKYIDSYEFAKLLNNVLE